ncbi:hypothetical protein Mapa_008577 [Marchantia paleacea]|nr:hypothetical protein Mapa_008577 [Marchantia paleacea]
MRALGQLLHGFEEFWRPSRGDIQRFGDKVGELTGEATTWAQEWMHLRGLSLSYGDSKIESKI